MPLSLFPGDWLWPQPGHGTHRATTLTICAYVLSLLFVGAAMLVHMLVGAVLLAQLFVRTAMFARQLIGAPMYLH